MMHRTARLVLVSFLVASPTGAQVVLPPPGQTVAPDLTYDRATLPLGLDAGTAWQEELDGVADTPEFLQFVEDPQGSTWIRGFAPRAGAWCVGPWIQPSAYAEALPGDRTVMFSLYKIGGRVKVLIVGDRRMYRTVPIPYGCE